MIEIRKATLNDISIIQDLAEKTWWPTYSPILEQDQIEYMLSVIYATEALTKSFEDGHEFILLIDENQAKGFASYSMRPEEHNVYKLHKLYVLPTTQKKGYGRTMLEYLKGELLKIEIHILDLNVNRYNPAIPFYQKMGFKIIREEDVSIGSYWMNDYVMRLSF